MSEDKLIRAIIIIIVTFIIFGIALFGGIDIIFSIPGLIISGIIMIMFSIAVSDIVGIIVSSVTNKDESQIVAPFLCIGISIISLIIGLILYQKNRHEILGDLTSWFVWVYITAPTFIASIISFVKFFKRNYKIEKKTDAQNEGASNSN